MGVYADKFDPLVEEAVVLPRMYGFAPKAEDIFSSVQARIEGRAQQFKTMDTDKNGYITLEEWIKFAINHIMGKVTQLPKDVLTGKVADVTKADFVTFIKKAVDKSTPEYRELYFFLLKTFQKGDVNMNGTVDPVAFDLMVEDAVAAPRRFGLAPSTEEMFSSDADRLEKRKADFMKMDNNGDGEISFNEWLDYAYNHIVAKVAGLS